jgi:hypothetical protein
MAGNLDSINPEVTIASVFEEVHQQAQTMVERLNELRVAEYGESAANPQVPGFRLLVETQVGKEFKGGRPCTAVISALVPPKFRLVGVTHVRRTDPSEGVVPTYVKAYRGREHKADYSIKERGPKGNLVTYLGREGVKGRETPDEPFGEHEARPEELVATLNREDKQRLCVVRNAVIKNLDVVELILQGAPVAEIFKDGPPLS